MQLNCLIIGEKQVIPYTFLPISIAFKMYTISIICIIINTKCLYRKFMQYNMIIIIINNSES